jgi:ABC-type antimicrobial peptide transport system permease subunit
VEQVAGVVTFIGLVALMLAGVGLIGLVSFTVRQKTKEIAVRLALGSSHTKVLKTILQQLFWPAAIGLFVGAGSAAAASKILRRALYGVSNLDPIGYLGAIGVLLAMLIVAALLPARRALQVNVAKALHYE